MWQQYKWPLVLAGLAVVLVVVVVFAKVGGSDEALLEKIASEDGDRARKAQEELAKESAEDVTRILRRSLDRTDARAACRILLAMGRRPRDEYLSALRQAVKDPRAEVKVTAIVSLERQKKAEDLRVFVRELEAEEPAVRAAAAQSIGRRRSWDSGQHLIDALEDPSETVRRRAYAAIRQIVTGIDFRYRANDPEPKRRAAIKRVRKGFEIFYRGHLRNLEQKGKRR